MGIFSSIKNAIFGRRQQPQAPQMGAAGVGAAVAQNAAAQAQQVQQQQQAQASLAQSAPAEPVDVEQVLQEISREKGDPDLNWRTSIVDLMKLLDLDSSLDNRRELATELGYTGEKNGSAEMNMWLHRRTMEELERNGGRIPQSMKD